MIKTQTRRSSGTAFSKSSPRMICAGARYQCQSKNSRREPPRKNSSACKRVVSTTRRRFFDDAQSEISARICLLAQESNSNSGRPSWQQSVSVLISRLISLVNCVLLLLHLILCRFMSFLRDIGDESARSGDPAQS